MPQRINKSQCLSGSLGVLCCKAWSEGLKPQDMLNSEISNPVSIKLGLNRGDGNVKEKGVKDFISPII